MRKRCHAILPSVLLSLLVTLPARAGASAEAPPAGPAVAGGAFGPLRAAVPAPGPVSEDAPGAVSTPERQIRVSGSTPPAGETVYEVDLGKAWNVSPEYFRKVFDGAHDEEPTGLNAKIDLHIHGVIRTRWGPADMLFGSMARFFAASPVLLDREYAVRRTLLFD